MLDGTRTPGATGYCRGEDESINHMLELYSCSYLDLVLLLLANGCFMSGIRKMKRVWQKSRAGDTVSFLLHRLFWERWHCKADGDTSSWQGVAEIPEQCARTCVHMCCACTRPINLSHNRRASSACPSVKWGGCQCSCLPGSNWLPAGTGIWDSGSIWYLGLKTTGSEYKDVKKEAAFRV